MATPLRYLLPLLLAVPLAAVLGASAQGQPCVSITYTTDPDFNLGDLNGVVTAGDQLELSATSTTIDFAWIANSADGTISKVNTLTGNEVARYYTGPPNTGGAYTDLKPSRTAIDHNGNCWVANRFGNGGISSVTMILAEGGIDRNTNSNIETSMDANGSGVIEPGEMYLWGDDERVIRHYLVGDSADVARALAIDKAGFLWVGLYFDQRLVKLDPTLSTLVYGPDLPPSAPPELASIDTSPVGIYPYGIALSPTGLLYTLSGFRIAEFDPGLASGGTAAGPAITQYVEHPTIANYGIVVDQKCIVWAAIVEDNTLDWGAIRWDPTVGVGNPALGWAPTTPGAAGPGRGITVDFQGDIWMACNDSLESVAKFDGAGNFIANYSTGLATPVGVGIASDEDIVVVGQDSNNWAKLDQDTGAILPLAGPQLLGNNPYSYSDFTGSSYNIVALQQGYWTVISDAGFSGAEWVTIDWTESTPPLTDVEVEARASNVLASLPGLSWNPIPTGGTISPPMPGRYLETRVRLQRDIDECGAALVTPVLYDLTVEAICDSCFIECPPDTVVACTGQGGAVVAYPNPVLGSSCGPQYAIQCTPPSGSLFPEGSTVVDCIAFDGLGDTLECHFEVFVTPCDTDPTGPCCVGTDCYVATEHDCLHNGGIYLGAGGDCTGGCPPVCVRPPRCMAAWYPMDGETGGVTPNLAEPAAGGAVNGATPLVGEYVQNAYGFDGADDYIEAPDHPSLDLGLSDFSIDCWIRTQTSTGFVPIVDKRNISGGPTRGYYFYLENGYPGLDLFDSFGSSSWTLSSVDGGPAAFVADNAWHQVAVTVDRNAPNGLRFYVDGVQVGAVKNPTPRNNPLDNAATLWIGRNHLVANQYAAADIDEVEIVLRRITAAEIGDLFAAGTAGKCREACYATSRAICCNSLTANVTVTLCNYDLVSHLYSWGLSPATGAGCSGTGASLFSPAAGSVVVGQGDCVNIPVSVVCPTGVPLGTESCFKVNVFNHDTGNLFDCLGSVRRPGWWCHTWASGAQALKGVVGLFPGITRNVTIAVKHIGPFPVAATMDYEVRAVAADGVTRSEAISLDGRAPGASVFGSIDVPVAGANISVNVSYPKHKPLSFDRIVLYTDDTMDGVPDPTSEIAVRSDDRPTVDAPGRDPIEGGLPSQRLFLAMPNPFSRSATVRFRVTGTASVPVTLQAFDVSGREVRRFHMDTLLEPGVHEVSWDGRDKSGRRLASGMYYLRLTTPTGSETVRALMLR